jgi:putative glutamine amidotransferase
MTVRIGVSYIWNEQRGRDYLASLRAAGAEPVVLATAETCPQWPSAEQAQGLFDPANPAVRLLDEIDGLLLTGGGDIDPMLYRAVIAGSEEPHWPRDHVETAQFHRARERELPILGICRGVQFLNVAMGGGMVQHLSSADAHRDPTPKHETHSHLVRVCADSFLARLYADNPREDLILGVNSYHHQAVSRDTLAPGLIATARSCVPADEGSGIVEALETPATREGREFVVGVQWHPERSGDPAPRGDNQPIPFRDMSARLFRAFVSAAESRHSRG